MKSKLALFMSAALLCTTTSLFSMQQQLKIYIPSALSPYFSRMKGKEVGGKAVGWLKVPGQGKVWIKLVGKSFYKRNRLPKDYRIKYIGHDTNGLIYELPKGLFYWKEKSRQPAGGVMPANTNKFAGQAFDYDSPSSSWALFSSFGPTKKLVKWKPTKAEHVHPSKEISELFKHL